MKAHRLSALSSQIAALTLALGAASVSAAGCGMDNAVVGGACADGFALCGDVCVNVENDRNNCGGCGDVCPAAEACYAGQCVVPSPSTTIDGAPGASDADGGASSVAPPPGESDAASVTDDAASEDATGGAANEDGGSQAAGEDAASEAASGGASDAGGTATTDSGASASDASSSASSDASSSASSDASSSTQSDASSSASSDASSTSSPDAGGGPACVAPLVSCGGACVDIETDPLNCGACGSFCPTYICQAGQCLGSLSGQMVLIGHDYASSIPAQTPQARVLENAVFGSGAPIVRVYAYEQYAAPQAAANVAAILGAYATATNKQIILTSSNDAEEVPSHVDVASVDVVLVLDEPGAPAGFLGAIGTSWAPSLGAFAQAGGTVVVLDGATAPEMPLFVTNAGMFALTAQTPFPAGGEVVNLAPGDVIGSDVESPYSPLAHSAYFGMSLDSPNITVVVFDEADGAPVVVQRVF